MALKARVDSFHAVYLAGRKRKVVTSGGVDGAGGVGGVGGVDGVVGLVGVGDVGDVGDVGGVGGMDNGIDIDTGDEVTAISSCGDGVLVELGQAGHGSLQDRLGLEPTGAACAGRALGPMLGTRAKVRSPA